MYFLKNCEDCQNCFFSVDLKNCSNCLFCSNLRHKEYHIFNKPYSREEFIKQLNSYGLNVYENFAKAEDFYKGEFRKKFPFRAVYQTNCENCEGDNHENSKNLKGCFDCTACEDCSYGFQMDETYGSMDLNCMGYDRTEMLRGNGDTVSAEMPSMQTLCENRVTKPTSFMGSRLLKMRSGDSNSLYA